MFASEVLSSYGVELEREYRFQVGADDNMISIDGLRAIYEVIHDHCRGVNRQSNFNLDLPNPVNLVRGDSTWGLYRDDNKRTWGRRYSDYVRGVADVKLGSSLLGKIGETASRVKDSGRRFCFDFTRFCNWTPGDFGENTDSCWWSGYNIGRRVAFDSGLLAMRFFDLNRGRGTGSHGIGRVWIWADSLTSGLDCFNLYHHENLTMADIAGLLSGFLSESAGGLDLGWRSRDFEAGNALWINNTSSTVIFDQSYNVADRMYINLDLSGYHSCYECGCMLTDNDSYRVGERYFCESCFFDNCFMCENCGESHFSHDGVEVENYGTICEDCYRSGDFMECDFCGEAYHIDDMHEINGSFYCDSCVSRHGYICDSCGVQAFHHSQRIDDSGLCYECFNKVFGRCEVCREYVDRNCLGSVTVELYGGRRVNANMCNDCLGKEWVLCGGCGDVYISAESSDHICSVCSAVVEVS